MRSEFRFFRNESSFSPLIRLIPDPWNRNSRDTECFGVIFGGSGVSSVEISNGERLLTELFEGLSGEGSVL